MDSAQLLIRSVMRAFYDTRSILVIEALMMHSALRDDDMAYLMGMNTKDIHKLCAKLKEDRFLAVHTQNEPRPGQARGVNRTYYYIDYRIAVDAIKWRVYKIDKDMQGTAIPANEVKEYFCNFCKASYTQMEVLDSPSAHGFLCQRCGKVLVHDRDRQSIGHQQSTRMNNQFRFIADLLPRIDSEVVPDNTFAVASSNARPVERAETHRVERSDPIDSALNRPTAVKGLANTGPTSISVNIQTADDLTEEEQAAERARKEQQRKKNQLPAWHSYSTVSGESVHAQAGAIPGTELSKEENGEDQKALAATKRDEEERAAKQKAEEEEANMQAIFDKIKAEQEAKAAEEEGDESEEDDEDEFEDVVGTTSNSAAGTPAAFGAVPVAPSPLRQSSVQPLSSLKREAPGSEATVVTATSTNGENPGSEDRPAKKIKMEEEASAPNLPDDDEDDDEDDVEFEDV